MRDQRGARSVPQCSSRSTSLPILHFRNPFSNEETITAVCSTTRRRVREDSRVQSTGDEKAGSKVKAEVIMKARNPELNWICFSSARCSSISRCYRVMFFLKVPSFKVRPSLSSKVGIQAAQETYELRRYSHSYRNIFPATQQL